MLSVRQESLEDTVAIAALHARVFPAGWHGRPAARLRAGVPAEPGLCLTAWAKAALVGSVRLTAVRVGDTPVWLLGPLAVDPDWHGHGAGAVLMQSALDRVRSRARRPVLLVGELSYYSRFGFESMRGRVQLLGERAERILALDAPLSLSGALISGFPATMPAPAAPPAAPALPPAAAGAFA
ncbi:MAG: GNAT family N-acetyltransferase [Rhodothalassiaceae bacterium]